MKARITIDLELDIEHTEDNDEGVRETLDELTRRIHEVYRNEYMKNGEDLYGYEGPYVTKIMSGVTITDDEPTN